MYELSKDNLPDAFVPLFQRNNTIHSYPTRQSNHFHLPRTRTVFANKTIIFTGPKFWNSLNNELVESPSINSLKRKLRCFLLSKYTVAHIGGIFLFYPNLWNYFKNNLKIIDLDNSIHSQILLNNNLTMCVLRDC